MDVYRAIANFTAPQFNSQGRPIHTCLSFKKGDLFEVLESENDRTKAKVWWACRTTTEERKIGYVPSKYLKFHEKRPGKLKDSSPPPHPFTEEVRHSRGVDPRDIHGKALADLRQHAGEAPPSDFKVKDPVLSPTSPTAPNPAAAPPPTRSPMMMRSAHNDKKSPASTPTNKLSPSAIRVPFMSPLLPGSPVAALNSTPPSSPSSDRGRGTCNQCGQQPAPRSDVIDLSTAFPAWDASHQKAVAPLPGLCSHRIPSKAPPSQYQQQQQQPPQPKSNNNHTAQPISSPSHASPRKQQSQQVYPPGSPELRRNREGLIEPKKLVNPCLESKERQVLHRELMQISHTQGEMSAMLPKKSELRQVFEKRQEKQREKDKVDYKAKAKPDFEKELNEQVEKLQKQINVGEENVFVVDESSMDVADKSRATSSTESSPPMRKQSSQSEFVRMRAKLTEKAKS